MSGMLILLHKLLILALGNLFLKVILPSNLAFHGDRLMVLILNFGKTIG